MASHTVVQLPQPLLERRKIQMPLLPRVERCPQCVDSRILGVRGFCVHRRYLRVIMAVGSDTRREVTGRGTREGELVIERLWVAGAHSWEACAG